MAIIREFNLHTNAGPSIPPVIHVNQYDRGETWKFKLYQPNGQQLTPTDAAIVGIKSDGHIIANAGTVSGGVISITETEQMTAAPGKAVFEILFDNDTHGTANFIVLVEPSPTNDGIASESDLSLFQEAIDSISPATINAAVSAWMSAQLTPSEWVIDNSLTVANAAADAKAAGDLIRQNTADIGDLTELVTEDQSSLVGALNETKTDLYNWFTEDIEKVKYIYEGSGSDADIYEVQRLEWDAANDADITGLKIITRKEGTSTDTSKFFVDGNELMEYVIGDTSDLSGTITEEISDLKSAIGSTGLSQTEKNLIMTLFRAIPFTGDVHEAFNSLDSIWKGQTPTSFSITKSLTGCSIDNQTSTVSAGEEFIATITENTGYDLDSITVTMGGTNISASAVSNNVISIHSVNGNVVITAVATKANYTPVEYIVQSADGAYIDTGYYPKLTDTVECEFSLGVSNWSYIFSANYMTNIVYKLVTRGDNTAGRTSFTRRAGAYNTNATADSNFAAQLNTIYKFVETAPGVASLYNSSDVLVASLSDENVSSLVSEDAKIFLFIQASKNGVIASTSKTGLIQLRDFKIKNNLGNVIHHYIPVKDENDVACMYDTIDKQYLYDGSGNNNFSAGNEVTA